MHGSHAQQETVHVNRKDTLTASRIVLQTSWDDSPSLLHFPREGRTCSIPEHPLSMWAVVHRCFKAPPRAFVFHEQASLPYLWLAWACQRLGAGRSLLVYDMHDLHRMAREDTLENRVRFRIFAALERFAFGCADVRIMTVSNGLASVVRRKYGREDVTVVRSAPSTRLAGAEMASVDRKPGALLFLGTPNIFPVELLSEMEKLGLELHVYGRGLTEEWFESKLGYAAPEGVRLFGPYTPDSLAFISAYDISLVFAASRTEDNIRYCLPNKLFQALGYGCKVLLSENLEEATDLFEDLPAFVTVKRSHESLQAALSRIGGRRSEGEYRGLVAKLQEIGSAASGAYRRVTGADTLVGSGAGAHHESSVGEDNRGVGGV